MEWESSSAEIEGLRTALEEQKRTLQGDLERSRRALRDGEEVTRALREALNLEILKP